MPVRRHGNTWEARVQSAGKRFGRHFKNRRDALEWERRVRARIDDHRVGRTPAHGLEEAIERWLTGEASQLRSHADLVDKARTIYPYIQGKALEEIVDVAEALKRDAIARKAAPATVNRKLAILRRVARLAHRQWGWLTEPLGDRVTLLPGERQRHVYLTAAQVRKLARAAPAPAREAILLAAYTGLRLAELLRLQPEHRRNGVLSIGETKTGRPRIIPLHPDVARVRLPLQIARRDLRRDFEAARAAVGRPDLHFHDLRHTFASWLVQSEAGLTVVRDLLGHSSLSVTSRYAHLSTAHLRAAVDRLPSARGGRGGRGAAQNRKKAA